MNEQPPSEPDHTTSATHDDERQKYIDDLNRIWNERQAERHRSAASLAARKDALEPSLQPAPQSSADPYAGMGGELTKSLRSLKATLEEREQQEVEATHEPPKPETPEEPAEGQQLNMFPQWGDERRAASAAIFRSALFPPLNFKKGRPYLKEAKIYAARGIEISFTGEQFDQSDLDVYLELLQHAREVPFGVECGFSAYGFLHRLGRATGKANHKWLHSAFIRLCAGFVDMTDHQVRYFGHLVDSGIKDEITKHYCIHLNPQMARLFRGDLWASLDIQERRALKQNQTAKALHAYYSTHVKPGPHRYETLAAIIGLKNSNQRQLKACLVKAHGMLKGVDFLSDFEAGTDTITPQVNHTPSQNRHIIKKIIKGGKDKET